MIEYFFIGFQFTAGSVVFLVSLSVSVNFVCSLYDAIKDRKHYKKLYGMSVWQVFKRNFTL